MATPRLVGKDAIISEVRRIAKKSGSATEFEGVEALVDKIFDSKTPTYRISTGATLVNALFGGGLVQLLPEDEKSTYTELLKSLVAVLEERGYREGPDIASFQEHRLIGSTQSVKHTETPYVPIGILDGKLNVQETRKARELAVMRSVFASYYSLEEGTMVQVVLEPLNGNGETIRDPRILDMAKLDAALATLPFAEALDTATIIAQRSADFPFRRD